MSASKDLTILGYAALRGSYFTFSECWTVSGPAAGSLRPISKRDIVAMHIYNCCALLVCKTIAVNRMEYIKLIFLVLATAIVGCSSNKLPDPQPINCFPEPEPVTLRPDSIQTGALQINNVAVVSKSISIEFTCPTPDPCWRFSSLSKTVSNDVYTLIVFARRSTGMCPTVPGDFKACFQTIVPAPGSYEFRFLRNNLLTLDTTILVH